MINFIGNESLKSDENKLLVTISIGCPLHLEMIAPAYLGFLSFWCRPKPTHISLDSWNLYRAARFHLRYWVQDAVTSWLLSWWMPGNSGF